MWSNLPSISLRAERLESRHVPSVTASLVGSTLVLQADNAHDAVVVTQEHGQVVVNGFNTPIIPGASPTAVSTGMAGMSGMSMGMMGTSPTPAPAVPTAGAMRVPYAARAVKMIEFVGGGGNDIFVNETAVNALAQGGPGNDVFVGGRGHDTLMGGAGNDALVGGQGMSMLVGGAGRDLFVRGVGHSVPVDANPADGDVVL